MLEPLVYDWILCSMDCEKRFMIQRDTFVICHVRR